MNSKPVLDNNARNYFPQENTATGTELYPQELSRDRK